MSFAPIAAAPTALSPEFIKARITALKPGEKATYQLIYHGGNEIPYDKDGRAMPPRQHQTNSVQVPSEFPVSDPYANGGEGQEVMLAYTKGTRVIDTVGGGKASVPAVQPIIFTATSGGRVIVDSTNKNLYHVMECHPANADSVCPERRSSDPMFRRIQPDKSAMLRVNFGAQVTEARNVIHNASTDEKLFMAEVLRLNIGLDGNGQKGNTHYVLTDTLNEIANTRPDVIINANRSEAAKAKQLVRDLDTYEQARYNPEKSLWQMSNGDQLGPAIQSGANASEELARWFQFSQAGIERAKVLGRAVQEMKDKSTKRR